MIAKAQTHMSWIDPITYMNSMLRVFLYPQRLPSTQRALIAQLQHIYSLIHSRRSHALVLRRQTC